MSRLAGEFRVDDAALREKWVYLVQVADSSSISLPEVLASLEQEGAMSAAEVARIVLIDEEEGSEEDEHEEDEHEEDEHEARVSDDVLSSLAEPRGPSPLRLPRRPEIDKDLRGSCYDATALVHAQLLQREAGNNTNRAGACPVTGSSPVRYRSSL